MAEARAETKRGVATATAAIGTLLGLAAVYVVASHLAGRGVPFVTDDRTAFIVLGVIGIVMCGFGIQTVLNSTGPLSPGMFVGAALGVLILIAFVMALMNRPMFLFADYRAGFIALAVAMLVKWTVSTVGLIQSYVAK